MAAPARSRGNPDARRIAADVVLAVTDGRSLADALPPALQRLSPAERGLAQELAYGVVRWYPRLSWVLGRLLERPLRRRDRDVEALLRVGLYQCLEMRIPDHAAVSETVRVARTLRRPWAGGLVNAVLRRCVSERARLEHDWESDETACHAHPQWLIDRFRNDWPADWAALLAANNERPPLTLRVNRQRSDRSAYLERLAAAGHEAQAHPAAPDGVVVSDPVPVDSLPGFGDGLVSVQDAAGQQAAALLAPEPGHRVLDLCAAPGGKTCHILETEPTVAVVALDHEAGRLERVRENLTRLGLDAELVAGDGTRPADWWDGQPFDRVLLDAPCSATGVIRRHPDIKLLRQPDDIAALQATQRRLLDAAWSVLAPGGILVYATCSVLAQENDGVIDDWRGVAGKPATDELPVSWGRAADFGRQILTGETGMDGFYYARLVKPCDG